MNPYHRLAGHALAALALALLAACGSKEGRIDSGLKKGADFVRTGAWDKASVEVRNVLQIDPKNAQAFFIAAQVAEGQREIQRAYGSYLKAIELKPDMLDAKVGLARVYMFAGDMGKAESTIKEVLAADQAHLGARTLDAALTAQRGNNDEALVKAKALIDGQKAVPVDTSMLLAGLYANQGKSGEALAVIERALQAEPKNTSLLLVAANIASTAPKTDPISPKAVDYFKRSTEAAPKNTDLWRAWAGYHVQRNELDLAETVLRNASKADPSDTKRTLVLIEFLNSARGFTVAEQELKTAITNQPRDMGLRFGLAGLYRSVNRSADTQRVLAEVIDLSDDAPSTLNAKTQLSAYHLNAGRLGETRRLVAEVLKASPRDNAALVLRGRLHLLDGNARDAVQDLRAVVKDQPGSAEVVSLLAQAHRGAGEPQLAREVLADAVKFRAEDPDLRLMLAMDMADAKEFRSAANEVDAALKLAPQAPRFYEAKVKLLLVQKDVAGAEKALKELKINTPKQAVGYVQLGKFYTEQKRFNDALKEYDAGIAAAPGDPLPYLASIGLLVGTKKFDEANARIDTRLKTDAKNVLHYQLKGDVALAKKDLAAAEQAYRGAIAVAPTIPVGYVNAGRVLAMRGDIPGALAVLSQGEQAAPGELSIPMARAEWLTRAKRYDEAIALYEALLKRAPDDDTVANNLAYLLTDMKGDRASVERALTLATRFAESRNAGYLDSLGWAHHKLGQYDKAVPVLEKAVALAPASPIVNLHLGKALVKSGNLAKGKEHLRRAVDSKADLPNLDEARAMLAQG